MPPDRPPEPPGSGPAGRRSHLLVAIAGVIAIVVATLGLTAALDLALRPDEAAAAVSSLAGSGVAGLAGSAFVPVAVVVALAVTERDPERHQEEDRTKGYR